MPDRARFDVNNKSSLFAVSNADGVSPVSLWADPSTHGLVISATLSGADGAIVDGSSSAIRATVESYANANPLTVRLSDTNGDYVAAGAGTQYTDGGTPPVHPVGGALIFQSGGVWVDVKTANPLPVSAVQSGTWNVTNISGTVSLPTGASTSAKQPALGTAGTASADVITVQGIASMTALKVDGSAVTQPISGSITSISTSVTPGVSATNLGKAEDAPHTSGDTGVFMLGVRNDSFATLTSTDGDYSPIAVDSTGRLKTLVTGLSNLSDGTELTTAHGLKVTLEGTAANATAVKVDGSAVTQPVSGTITANAGTNLNTSALALDATLAKLTIAQGTALGTNTVALIGGSVTTNAPTFTTGQINQLSLTTGGGLRIDLKDTASNTNNLNVNLAASAATVTVTATNLSTNLAQIAGVATATGNGVVGTGVQRVAIASDNTAFSVNATLSAETTKVIGVVRTADGAGNLYTTNSTTYTAKFAQDGNLLGTLGTAFSTAGKVDVKGADGDVFVRQATAANLNATVVGTGTFAVQAAQSGNWGVSNETSSVYNGTTALTPKFATITASASGATTLVAAVTSKKLRVLNLVLIASGTVNVKFQSHVTPTDITGLLYLTTNTGFAPGYSPIGHFQTVAGEALDINLSGAVAVGGYLTYIEV